MENELISTKELEELIIARKVKEVRNIFEVVPTIDIAEACDDFEDISHLVFIFKFVKSEYTADLFTELASDTKERLIQVMSDSELARILESQFTDDLVDDVHLHCAAKLATDEAHGHHAGTEARHVGTLAVVLQFLFYVILVVILLDSNGQQTIDLIGILK